MKSLLKNDPKVAALIRGELQPERDGAEDHGLDGGDDEYGFSLHGWSLRGRVEVVDDLGPIAGESHAFGMLAK